MARGMNIYGDLVPCPYVPDGVDCQKREMETKYGECVHCGFNPAEKERRLAESYGKITAKRCCEISEELTKEFEKEQEKYR